MKATENGINSVLEISQSQKETRLFPSMRSTASFSPSFLTKCISHISSLPGAIASCTFGISLLVGASYEKATIVAGVSGTVVLLTQILAFNILSGGNTLRSAVFVGANHMTGPDIQGGMPFIIIPHLLDVLEESEPSEDVIIAKNCLQSCLNYENYYNIFGLNNGWLIADILKKINSLKEDEIIAIPFSSINLITDAGHIIIGTIQRIKNGKFIVRVHNAGEGSSSHHREEDKIQTFVETNELDEETLASMIKAVSRYRAIGASHTTREVYELISPSSNKSEDPRHWSDGQSGNSCSGYSIRCLLQFLLTEEHFQEFEKKLHLLSAKKLKSEIERGFFWENTSAHYAVFEEMRVKASQRGVEIPAISNKPSLLSDISFKIQKEFWGIVFNPSYSFKRSFWTLILGRDPTDNERSCDKVDRGINQRFQYGLSSESRWLLLKTFDVHFRDLGAAWATFYEDEMKEQEARSNYHRESDRLAREEALDRMKTLGKKMVESETKLAKCYLENSAQVNRSKTSGRDLNILDEDFSKIKSIRNYVDSTDLTYQYSYWGSALDHLYRVRLSQIQVEFSDPIAKEFFEAMCYLRQGNWTQARSLLEKIFPKIEELYEAREEESCHELPVEYRYAFFMALTMPSKKEELIPEAIDLYAGAVRILSRFGFEKAYTSRIKNLYFSMRLNNQFPNSPWKNGICRDWISHDTLGLAG